MIHFKYDFGPDVVELHVSSWCGLEQVFVNRRRVSCKLNFKRRSLHQIELTDGRQCQFELLIDPVADALMCRVYAHNQFVTSLKQHQAQLILNRYY